MSTAVMWSKSKPDVEFQYGGHLGEFSGMSSQSHQPHCRVAIIHLVNSLSRFQSHMPHCHLAKSMSWSCHIAGSKKCIRHIENRFSPYFIFLVLMQFTLWRVAAFVLSPIHLFYKIGLYVGFLWGCALLVVPASSLIPTLAHTRGPGALEPSSSGLWQI